MDIIHPSLKHRQTAVLAFTKTAVCLQPLSSSQMGSCLFLFSRMFHILTGFTVVEYVRNRRLTLYTQELAMGNARVFDVALKYGYDTPGLSLKPFADCMGESFDCALGSGVNLKAFRESPSIFRLRGIKI